MFKSKIYFLDIEVTTIIPIHPSEINKLAESKTEFITTTDFDSDLASETPHSKEKVPPDVNLRNKLKLNVANLPPDIETILNSSKHKINDDIDYDYNEPTLPPSLPNLK